MSSADVTLWRLVRPQYAPGLDGLGAKRVGGRWTSPGRPAVYCAGSLSLAVLETFVHLPPNMRIAGKLPAMTCVRLALPAHLVADLDPDGLRQSDGEAGSRALGDGFLAEGAHVGLRVPSMVVPVESNVVLNPLHADFERAVRVVSQTDFRYDPRMGR